MALIATQTIKGPFEAIAANGADMTLTAGNAGGDTFTCTGREILIVLNTGVGARTFTITSTADEKLRTGNITAYNLDAGEYAVLGIALTNSPGWKDISTNLITITPSHAEVKWAVLKLPTGYPG